MQTIVIEGGPCLGKVKPIKDMVEERELAFLRPRIAEFLKDHSGLTEYQLGLLIKLTGSKAVTRTYRERMNKIGPYGRDERGIVQ